MKRGWEWQGRLSRRLVLSSNLSFDPRSLGRNLPFVILVAWEFGIYYFVSSECLYLDRFKKVVNNPWGNRGRKKCGACRSRKRSVRPIWFLFSWKCIFDDEGNTCEFCTTHGGRCGPKVLAEKAKYYHTKRVDDLRDRVMDAAPPESSESIVSGGAQISQTSEPFTNYGHPPRSHTPTEPSRSGIKMEGGDIPEDKELKLDSGSIQICRS